MKYIKKAVEWLKKPNQQWIKITTFLLSVCLTVFYFVFPTTVCGWPFLITGVVILVLALFFYYREKEAEIMWLLCSIFFSMFGVASVFICLEFVNRKNDIPAEVKTIEIITLILGVFGVGFFVNTIKVLIHKYKKINRDNKGNPKFPYAAIVSILTSAFGLVTAILNSVTSFMKVHS